MQLALVFSTWASSVWAAATLHGSGLAVHEKRDSLPNGWQKTHKLDNDFVIPMSIALKQSNLDQLDEYIMSVSSPSSAEYGSHWTSKQVAEAFAPSEETAASVLNWLHAAGIPLDRVYRSTSLGWLKFALTVKEAEELLHTEYHMYEHVQTGVTQVGCKKYHVPHHVRRHVDFITPTLHFDAKLVARDNDASLTKRAAGTASSPWTTVKQGQTYPSLPWMFENLLNCTDYITPDCLRALYRIPPVFSNIQQNPFGIVEYTPQSFVQSDLDLFFNNFSHFQVQRTPVFDSIDGGVVSNAYQGFGINGESDLDLEYGMTLVNPITVTLYQTGDLIEGASFDNFLDAIDSSFCTFEGADDPRGDDPTQDGIYPDPLKGGYKGPENCGGFAATKVISTSYSYNEVDLSPAYEQRQCLEYAKLGLQGVSILYSSGDDGVAGNNGGCMNAKTGNYTNGKSGMFVPSYPGTCPFVTSVGATQVNGSVFAPEVAADVLLPQPTGPAFRFSSSGGFSNVFPLPSYQQAAVAEYYANYDPPYGAKRYNNSRAARGIPDVSANGAYYTVAIDGTFQSVFGTSCSSPVFASILTIINEYRAHQGKSSVGFVNPVLYAHPEVLNDITEGNNPGCGTNGFSAVPGWDPVTGLGTPNTPKMLELFLSLP